MKKVCQLYFMWLLCYSRLLISVLTVYNISTKRTRIVQTQNVPYKFPIASPEYEIHPSLSNPGRFRVSRLWSGQPKINVTSCLCRHQVINVGTSLSYTRYVQDSSITSLNQWTILNYSYYPNLRNFVFRKLHIETINMTSFQCHLQVINVKPN